MRKTILAALALAVLACAAASAQKTFTVSNMDQFLRAIGPDRTIVLKTGTYTVKKSASVKNQYFRWDEVGSGDFQLTVQNLANLTLKAQSSDVGIIAATAYAYVLAFEDCESIRLEGLTMGHEASEPCMAGVVSFMGTSDVTIDSCDLYGSGAWGVNAEGCTGITLTATTIRDCSSAGAWFGETSGVVFEDCKITSNAADPLFYLSSVDSVSFTNCEISYNSGAVALSIEGDPIASVDFTECAFDSNDVAMFYEQGPEVYFTDCTFDSNAFGDDPDAITGATSGGEGYEEEGYGGDEEIAEPYVHFHQPAGLAFTIPGAWESQENEDGTAVNFKDPESETGIIVIPAYAIPAGGNVDKNAKGYLDEGLKGFVAFMEQADATASVTMDGEMFDIEGLPAADFRGTGQYDGTQDLYYWVRLIISQGKVWAVAGASDQEELMGEESDLASIINSVALAPEGQ